MAQVPAVPKLTRARHLLRTTVFGRTDPTADMVASERAALALRASGHPFETAQQVTFLLPMVGPDQVGDWDAVAARLRTTLDGFIAQDTPEWRAAICCQSRPDLPDDPRISYLPFTDPTPGNDKWRKLRVLCDALPDLASGPGYAMSFDADDLLRQGTVKEMLSRQERGGYLVQSGYVKDVSNGGIGLADKRSWSAPMRKPFWKLCGSCAAVYHNPSDPSSTAFMAEMTQHEHRMFPYLARLAGKDLAPLSRPSVLYMLNHGENFGARRGRVGYKTRFVQTYRIDDPDCLAGINQDFTF